MSSMFELVGDALEIAEKYEALMANAEDGGEEMDERAVAVLASEFGQTEAALRDKVDAYIAVIRQYVAWEQNAKEEAKRLQDRAKSHAANAKRLKEVLKFAMETLEIDKTKTPLNTVSLADNPSIPYEVDEAELPDAYLRTQTSVDRSAIQKALKAGIEIDGVTVQPKTKSLRIR